MSDKRGTDTGTKAEEEIRDQSQVLSLQAVKGYADRLKERGHVEYNKGSILVRSLHPLDQCLRRGIIEEEHHEIGKRLRNYRDCALSKLSGRTYNASGEGDSEMDAATIYANLMRAMNAHAAGKQQWQLVSLVCFAEPDIDGRYWSEVDYSAVYKLATNLQHAIEQVDGALAKAKKSLTEKLKATRSEN